MGRPTSTLVFGILNIIAAVFGVCGIGFYILLRAGTLQRLLEKVAEADTAILEDPTLQLLESNTAYRLFLDTATVLGTIGVIVLLTSAIGLLAMKPWARVVTIAYGVFRIVMVVFVTIVTVVLIVFPTLEATSGTDGPERDQAVMEAIETAVGLTLVTGYWLLAIFFMTRRKVVAAFEDPMGFDDDDIEPGLDMPWRE